MMSSLQRNICFAIGGIAAGAWAVVSIPTAIVACVLIFGFGVSQIIEAIRWREP